MNEVNSDRDRYAPFSPTALPFLLQKELNRSSDLGKGARTLYASQKFAIRRSANFESEFLGRKDQTHKKDSYISHLKEGLIIYSTFTTFIYFSITNHNHFIRECLEFYPPFNHRQGLKTQSCSNQQHNLGF